MLDEGDEDVEAVGYVDGVAEVCGAEVEREGEAYKTAAGAELNSFYVPDSSQ